jgi:AraC-like DNA-binding protein
MRSLGLAGLDEAENVRALMLERGEARLRRQDGSVLPLTGPAAGWFPWSPDLRLELAAGAQGCHLLLGRATLTRALARSPETADLRFMADRSVTLHLAPDEAAASAIGACFAGILAETLRPGALSATVVESFLRVLLVHLHRGQSAGAAGPVPAGGGPALAGRFAALVEAHLRDRWPVARYAAELRVSADRLTDICQRAHGRPPGQMIRERLALEARVYLEQSSLSIDEIAGVLGFTGAPQFSRFFSQMEGLPPGRFRARHRTAQSGDGAARAGPLYSWP